MTAIALHPAAWGFPAADCGGYAGPATSDQIGALHQEFTRLGYTENDRAARLEAAACLVGLTGLGSFRELTLGKAGWLLWHVSRCTTRAQLDQAIACAQDALELEDEQEEDERLQGVRSPARGGVLAAFVQALVQVQRAGQQMQPDMFRPWISPEVAPGCFRPLGSPRR